MQEGALHRRVVRFLTRTLHHIQPPDSSTTPRLTKTRSVHCGRNERISLSDPKSMCSHRDKSSNIFKMTTKIVGGRKQLCGRRGAGQLWIESMTEPFTDVGLERCSSALRFITLCRESIFLDVHMDDTTNVNLTAM